MGQAGAPGTDITVRGVMGWYKLDLSLEEIAEVSARFIIPDRQSSIDPRSWAREVVGVFVYIVVHSEPCSHRERLTRPCCCYAWCSSLISSAESRWQSHPSRSWREPLRTTRLTDQRWNSGKRAEPLQVPSG